MQVRQYDDEKPICFGEITTDCVQPVGGELEEMPQGYSLGQNSQSPNVMCRDSDDVSTCRSPEKKPGFVYVQTGNGEGVWMLADPPAKPEEAADPGIAEEDKERMAKGGPPPVCNGKNGEPGVSCRVARQMPPLTTGAVDAADEKKKALSQIYGEPVIHVPVPETPEEAKETLAKGGPPPLCDGKNGRAGLECR